MPVPALKINEDAVVVIQVIPDVELRAISVKISDERWAEMRKLADELAPYLE